ncbi:MAG: hypothetical protein LBF93_02375 [Zoogloeaceae bacterium]|jgi:hypothetical protein|nr:hypothetical protein [Zoogloeaceae bacterium]
MMMFRDLAARMDDVVFRALSDAAAIDGRPVRGMFYAPWLAPQIGQLKTGLVEPHLVVRDGDACGVEKGAMVCIDGFCDAQYEVVSIQPDGTGITALILRPVIVD